MVKIAIILRFMKIICSVSILLTSETLALTDKYSHLLPIKVILLD